MNRYAKNTITVVVAVVATLLYCMAIGALAQVFPALKSWTFVLGLPAGSLAYLWSAGRWE